MLRFAPSSSRDMHIGDMRVALTNYIVAKQHGEGFILRIEDIEQAHDAEPKDAEIKQLLQKFAIHHDQILYQSESIHRHQQLAVSLVEQDKAFVCTCTPEELEADRDRARQEKRTYRYSGKCINNGSKELKQIKDENTPYVIRIKQPQNPIAFAGRIKGEITTAPHDVDSFVILRADGNPTYNFACAVDDMLGGITLVIRSEDRISDTPRQIHIRHQLGFEQSIHYAHLPIILNTNGKKMSDQDDPSSIKWLLAQGFLPDAIINYLILLSNKTQSEVFTLPEAMEWLDLDNISKSPAKFDIDKLRLLNREHMKRMDDKALSGLYGFADVGIGKLIKVYLQEASTINELDAKIKPMFEPKPCKGKLGAQMSLVATLISEAPVLDTLDDLIGYIEEKSTLKNKDIFKPLRLILTGAERGPELSDIYPHIKSYLLEVARCQH